MNHPDIIDSELSVISNRPRKLRIDMRDCDDLSADDLVIYRRIDPYAPCAANPGSNERTLMMRKRYMHGLPIFNPFDARTDERESRAIACDAFEFDDEYDD